jgi:putative hydrolase of HD superfamily
MSDRLEKQLAFVMEIDALKGILRQTLIADGSRQENSAEHSWHLALMAGVLAEYAPPEVDLSRVVRMVLVHDLVEIDAGDTFCYDATANLDKAARERRCADRLFGLLEGEQGAEMRALWDEFETGATPDARYANALDRLQPFLENLRARGGTWRIHGVKREQVLQRMQPIRDAMPELWPVIESGLERAAAEGWVS